MSLLEDAKMAESRLKFRFPYNVDVWVNEMNMLMENYHKHTTWSDLIQIDSATDIYEFMELSNSYECQCYFSGEHGYPGEWLYVYDICKNSQDKDYRSEHGLSKEIKFRTLLS